MGLNANANTRASRIVLSLSADALQCHKTVTARERTDAARAISQMTARESPNKVIFLKFPDSIS